MSIDKVAALSSDALMARRVRGMAGGLGDHHRQDPDGGGLIDHRQEDPALYRSLVESAQTRLAVG